MPMCNFHSFNIWLILRGFETLNRDNGILSNKNRLSLKRQNYLVSHSLFNLRHHGVEKNSLEQVCSEILSLIEFYHFSQTEVTLRLFKLMQHFTC